MGFSPETSPRRQFVKTAVAIGGASALTACQERETNANGESQSPTTTDAGDGAAHPSGSIDPPSLPERQYAWNDYLVRDNSGNTVLPQHQLLLFLNYTGSGLPTADDRADAEDAFRTLEQAFQWGAGTNQGPSSTEGCCSRWDTPRRTSTGSTNRSRPKRPSPRPQRYLARSEKTSRTPGSRCARRPHLRYRVGRTCCGGGTVREP